MAYDLLEVAKQKAQVAFIQAVRKIDES
jgi:hypothetical protein